MIRIEASKYVNAMDKANPPECFKGTPISLIAAGLLALAFMGFSGMRF